MMSIKNILNHFKGCFNRFADFLDCLEKDFDVVSSLTPFLKKFRREYLMKLKSINSL